jgi:16S rRNA U1498 N3-methylase RsmE
LDTDDHIHKHVVLRLRFAAHIQLLDAHAQATSHTFTRATANNVEAGVCHAVELAKPLNDLDI